MKILLVQSYLGRKNQDIILFPIGLAYIADFLTGHDVSIIDLNMCDDPYNDLAKKIKDFQPDVVGLSLRNVDTAKKNGIFFYYKTVEPTVRVIKKTDKNVKIVIGGSGFSMFSKEIMVRVKEIDFGVYLEGEESFPELLNNFNSPGEVKGILYREGGEVVFTGPRPFLDFQLLPAPKRELFDMSKYSNTQSPNIGIQTKRGCSLKCAYCIYPFLVGKKMRVRSPESVVDEIEYLGDRFNVKKFMFVDSVFNLPENHAESVCKEILKRNLKVEWTAYFELKYFTEELVELVREAGCVLMGLSPDAASDESLKALGKGFTEAEIYEKLMIARKVKGLLYFFEFFCTPPQQDFRGFLKTIKMYFAIHFLLYKRGGANFNWIRIEPNTLMHKIAIDDGMLKKEDTLLPFDEKGLGKLFYSCPATKNYADPFFSFICFLKEKASLFMRNAPW